MTKLLNLRSKKEEEEQLQKHCQQAHMLLQYVFLSLLAHIFSENSTTSYFLFYYFLGSCSNKYLVLVSQKHMVFLVKYNSKGTNYGVIFAVQIQLFLFLQYLSFENTTKSRRGPRKGHESMFNVVKLCECFVGL